MNPVQAPVSHTPRPWVRWTGLRWLAWLGVLSVLLGIFSFYTHPDFMVDMADKIWACF